MIDLPICNIGMQIDPIWNTCAKLVQHPDELPYRDSIYNLYLDVETTSGDPDVKSTNPHKREYCSLLGISVTFDSEPWPFYIPLRHIYENLEGKFFDRKDNLPLGPVYDWLRHTLNTAKYWFNHNIKYDFHCIYYETRIYPTCQMIDTLVRSKLASIEEKFNYGLDVMLREMGIDISPYETRIKEFLGKGEKDYAIIPPDIMTVYSGVDTLAVRRLVQWLREKTDSDCSRIIQLETELLPTLIKMEQTGVRTDIERICNDYEAYQPIQQERIQKIRNITGYSQFDPGKKASLKELFVNRLGWELDYTESTKEKIEKYGSIPEKEIAYSFGYPSLMRHKKTHPELVGTYLDFRETEKLIDGFQIPYMTKHSDDNWIMKPTINQIIRTGRQSCRDPNMQQLSPEAKEYIIPFHPDYVLVEFDLSQIEFRVIAHYIQNLRCIKAYQENPETDFHTWVAEMCVIPRKPAKNVNFMLGYGGGREKTVAMLAELPEIVGELADYAAITSRAHQVYNNYHSNLPELKQTQWRASGVLRDRGFVKTLLGRHRHLPRKLHFKAFNTVCQGTAADFQKDITIRLAKFISFECILHFTVHDSWLWSIHKSIVEDVVPLILAEIEKPIEGVRFDVPIKAEYGISERNWRDCDTNSSRFKYGLKLIKKKGLGRAMLHLMNKSKKIGVAA